MSRCTKLGTKLGIRIPIAIYIYLHIYIYIFYVFLPHGSTVEIDLFYWSLNGENS